MASSDRDAGPAGLGKSSGKRPAADDLLTQSGADEGEGKGRRPRTRFTCVECIKKKAKVRCITKTSTRATTQSLPGVTRLSATGSSRVPHASGDVFLVDAGIRTCRLDLVEHTEDADACC